MLVYFNQTSRVLLIVLFEMSEELLQKFLTSIEQEDGITEVGKKKKNKNAAVRENVKTILHAASKGQVQLSAEESYIVQKPSTSKGSDYIDDRLVSQVPF